MKRILKIVIGLTCMLIPFFVSAQDYHLSQYEAAPVMLNPSYTGMMSGQNRLTLHFRDQWNILSSKYLTNGGAFDTKFKNRFGFGGYILNNGIPNSFNTFNFVLSGAYEIAGKAVADKKYSLRVGLQAGIIYQSIRGNNLTFNNQWNDGNFDTDLPSGESDQKLSKVVPELNYGISYTNINEKKKFNPYGGFSLFHITSPKMSYFSNDIGLPRRWVIHGGTRINLNDKITIDPHLLCMWQGKASEYNVGLLGYYQLTQDYSIAAGCSYRIKDAVIAHVALGFKNFVYRLSYDVNTSSLNEYSHHRGGWEISVIYMNIPSKKFSMF